MSTSFFDLKINEIYKPNIHPNANTPYKIIDSSKNINTFKKNINERNIFKKLFHLNKDENYDNKILSTDMKFNLEEKLKDEYNNIKYNKHSIKNNNFKNNLKNFLNDINQDEKLKEINFNKYLGISNSNKKISLRYNKYSDITKNNKKMRDTLISNSIDIIYNSPFNKNHLNNSLNKNTIDVNNIKNLINNYNSNENNENNLIKNDFNNMLSINFNEKPIHKRRTIKRKFSYNLLFDNEKESKPIYNLEIPNIPKEICHYNNKQKSLKKLFCDDYKDIYPYFKEKNSKIYNIQENKEYNKEQEREEKNMKMKNTKTLSNNLSYDKLTQIKTNMEIFLPRKKKKIKTNKIEENMLFLKQEKENEKTLEINREFEIEEEISNDELTEYYIKSNNIVLEYAYKEEINFINRTHMEDKGKSISNFNNDPKKILFCLFDGHGGDSVSTYLQKNFAKYMKKYLKLKEFNYQKEIDFIELFQKIDEKLNDPKYYEIGSTATIVYIAEERHKKILYCVNIGDTRCILTQNNGSRKLSFDDLATDKSEYDRIKVEGGYVSNGRVCGKLMISRAFSDWELKSSGVTCCPHITKIEIKENCKYVIIASDGVWDVLDDLDVYSLSLKAENSKELCNEIVKSSLEKDSKDNISCFVIKLNE